MAPGAALALTWLWVQLAASDWQWLWRYLCICIISQRPSILGVNQRDLLPVVNPCKLLTPTHHLFSGNHFFYTAGTSCLRNPWMTALTKVNIQQIKKEPESFIRRKITSTSEHWKRTPSSNRIWKKKITKEYFRRTRKLLETKHPGYPPCKILGTILKMNKGIT